jgi:hypothetical protein
MDGRHKAGHDDQRGGDREANDGRWLAAAVISPTIVMAGLVPAIHGLLSLSC